MQQCLRTTSPHTRLRNRRSHLCMNYRDSSGTTFCVADLRSLSWCRTDYKYCGVLLSTMQTSSRAPATKHSKLQTLVLQGTGRSRRERKSFFFLRILEKYPQIPQSALTAEKKYLRPLARLLLRSLIPPLQMRQMLHRSSRACVRTSAA